MVTHALKILQQMLQDFENASDHFVTVFIKDLRILIGNFYFHSDYQMTIIHALL